jgi:hypothetical protein
VIRCSAVSLKGVCALELGHEGPHQVSSDPNADYKGNPIPEPPDAEIDPIGWMIHRVTYYTKEAPAFAEEPLLQRAAVLAQLWQAKELKRIADAAWDWRARR